MRAKGETEMLNGKYIRLMGTFQDIDEKKKSELAFNVITERLALATAGADIGVWDFDIENNELIWDDMMYSIYGIAKKDFNGEYEAWQAGLHPDDKEAGEKAIAMAISGEKEFDTQFRIIWPNGDIKHIKAQAVTQTDENGKAFKMTGTNWDITPRVQAELKHKEIIERLNVATRAANIGIWDYRIKENTILCNDKMYSMYGIPEDASDLLNEWMKRIHPEDTERIAKELQLTITEGTPFNTQFRGIKPDGKVIHLIAFGEAQKCFSGNVKSIIGANWEITELRTTKLQLERSQESFKGTFENSAAGMALVDLDGKWISVNRGLCKSFGYTEEEFLTLTWQEITHPEDLDSDLELLENILNGKISTYQFEKRFYHKNGTLIYTLLTVTSAKDLDGNLSHLISQILDVSSIVHAEKRAQRLLNVTKEQNESLLNFAHIVSHNLRSHSSNLSMLSGFLSLEEDQKERANLLGMLKNASESLGETVMHLNEVVQVKAGTIEKLKNINLHKTIKSVQKNLSLHIKEKKAKCTVKVPSDLKLKGIPAYFDSIFLNLFSNSLKYSSSERPLVLKIEAHIHNNKTIISFEDNGLGIDLKRHRNKLFGMYKTFHKHKDAKGIGLFITKNQIEAMNGSITVESEVDVGTKFLLTFNQNN